MNETPDILVIGLGPAGACAAKAAALAGANVLAIEKKTTPGAPTQCAEFVPAMIGTEIASLRETTVQPITSMVTRVEQCAPDKMEDFPGRMIDRQSFDRDLAKAAQQAGADIRYGITVRELSKNGQVTLSTNEELQPKIIIGADGPHSIIGEAIGSKNIEILETRQINVDLLCPFDSTDIFLSHQMPGGYAWAFPKGNTVNIGLGVHPNVKTQLKPLLEDLHQQLQDEGRVGAKINSYTGGAIPAGGMLKPFGSLGTVHCLLAGDAAGLTNPITGAGINSAVISGKLAGQTACRILNNTQYAQSDYTEDLDDLFGASLRRALAHKQRLQAIFNEGARPTTDQMRSAWIAYPKYWDTIPATSMEKNLCPA